ncbi:hypothetical protein DICSQDRAFT_147813 [Dichomitus squalens LYAD-421 SS1]|uniref:Uncharacterized protein n=1 Tax=Dichomitus squalens (strain LYAD-421) TaxID=732165 RepID=R7SWY3_DICSQ|nr:uncharacterized protein DICSQDRAFT_147813 [Dichomitus squalens LYAD-421 SS1]EJF60601.1 hypothetical protein DICSQDRAFT_147813 [Dichomitus squalens LYAD-421 SS1]
MQQPRNTRDSHAVPYCQEAPKNSELNGLFQCQYLGTDQQTFVGGLALGSAGTIPFEGIRIGAGWTTCLTRTTIQKPTGSVLSGTRAMYLTSLSSSTHTFTDA